MTSWNGLSAFAGRKLRSPKLAARDTGDSTEQSRNFTSNAQQDTRDAQQGQAPPTGEMEPCSLVCSTPPSNSSVLLSALVRCFFCFSPGRLRLKRLIYGTLTFSQQPSEVGRRFIPFHQTEKYHSKRGTDPKPHHKKVGNPNAGDSRLLLRLRFCSARPGRLFFKTVDCRFKSTTELKAERLTMWCTDKHPPSCILVRSAGCGFHPQTSQRDRKAWFSDFSVCLICHLKL